MSGSFDFIIFRVFFIKFKYCLSFKKFCHPNSYSTYLSIHLFKTHARTVLQTLYRSRYLIGGNKELLIDNEVSNSLESWRYRSIGVAQYGPREIRPLLDTDGLLSVHNVLLHRAEGHVNAFDAAHLGLRSRPEPQSVQYAEVLLEVVRELALDLVAEILVRLDELHVGHIFRPGV